MVIIIINVRIVIILSITKKKLDAQLVEIERDSRILYWKNSSPVEKTDILYYNKLNT